MASSDYLQVLCNGTFLDSCKILASSESDSDSCCLSKRVVQISYNAGAYYMFEPYTPRKLGDFHSTFVVCNESFIHSVCICSVETCCHPSFPTGLHHLVCLRCFPLCKYSTSTQVCTTASIICIVFIRKHFRASINYFGA